MNSKIYPSEFPDSNLSDARAVYVNPNMKAEIKEVKEVKQVDIPTEIYL